METLLPALFHLSLALSVRIYKLNNPMVSRIATDLHQRYVQSQGARNEHTGSQPA